MECQFIAEERFERAPATGHLAPGGEISGRSRFGSRRGKLVRSANEREGGRTRDLRNGFGGRLGGRRVPRAVRTLMTYGMRVCSASRISLGAFGVSVRGARVVVCFFRAKTRVG